MRGWTPAEYEMIRFSNYTHIAPSRKAGDWYTLFSLTDCEKCGNEASCEESPHLRGKHLFSDAVKSGMVVCKTVPDPLGWCEDFGGGVCWECGSEH